MDQAIFYKVVDMAGTFEWKSRKIELFLSDIDSVRAIFIDRFTHMRVLNFGSKRKKRLYLLIVLYSKIGSDSVDMGKKRNAKIKSETSEATQRMSPITTKHQTPKLTLGQQTFNARNTDPPF